MEQGELTDLLIFLLFYRSESIVGHPEYKTTMRLTITNVDEQDENSYKCVAKNPRGESEGTIRLYCEYPEGGTTSLESFYWRGTRGDLMKVPTGTFREIKGPGGDINHPTDTLTLWRCLWWEE